MPRTDQFGNRCSYCVRLHIRQMENLWSNPSTAIENAQRFYGAIGIYLEVGSMLTTRLNPADYTRFTFLNSDCYAGQESRAQSDLFAQMGVGDYQAILVIFLVSISTKSQDLNGCASHSPHRAAVTVACGAAPWTLAHEIGHVLLGPSFRPAHSNASGNLMTSPSPPDPSSLPNFDFAQLAQVQSSPYLLRCR